MACPCWDSRLGSGARAGGPGGVGHSLLQQVQAGRHGGQGGLRSHREGRGRAFHFGTSEFFHHEEGIISFVIIIIIIIGRGGSFCPLPGQSSSSPGIKWIHHDWLRAFDLTAAEGTALAFRFLPGCETGGAHQVPTRFNLHILVVLSTDFTQLEGGAHLTVQLILFLCNFNVVLRCGLTQASQVRILIPAIRK